MAKSRIPLFGLPHRVSIVRFKMQDDGAGGVEASDTPVVLYSNIRGRVTTLEFDVDKQVGPGFRAGQFWRVIIPYSPKVLKTDMVRLPWGVPPNVESPEQLWDGFSPKVVISTPDGEKTLSWDGLKYVDSENKYSVFWSGSVWRFNDTVASLTHDFEGYSENQNIFKRPWNTEVGEDYAVLSLTGDSQDFRIVWMKHQYDEFGAYHHTSLIVELEDGNT